MCCVEHTSPLDKFGAPAIMWPVSPVEHPGRRPSASCRAPGWLARCLACPSRPQKREARLMCCVEHASQLDKFGARVVTWPVSPVGHPGRRPSASCRASGWLARCLACLSRPQVREARLMCCVERTSQLGKFGARVVTWPVSPVEHPGRRPSASCRASGWLARCLACLSRPQVREARPMCCVEHTSQLGKFGARVVVWPVSPVEHPGRRPSASCRASGWLARCLARPSRPQKREARLMCCVERASQLGKFGARVVTWPVSPVGHPGRRPSASCRASGWLARCLACLSRPQVREARLMCCVERTSQLDKFGDRVVVWPVSLVVSFCAVVLFKTQIAGGTSQGAGNRTVSFGQ